MFRDNSNEMEIKAETGPFPVTEEEKKLCSQSSHLIDLVQKVAEPWMSKRWSKTLHNLMRSETQLFMLCRWLMDPNIELIKRQCGVASIFYHCDFKFQPFTITKLKGDSLWVRMRKSLGKGHQAQVDQLYRALKTYVEPVSLGFINAK